MPYQNMESRHLPGGTGRVLGRGRLCGGIALFGYDVGGSLPAEEKTNVFFPIAGIVPNKPWLYKNGLSYWVLVLRPGWKDLPASKNEVDAIVRLLDSEDVETSVYTGKEGSEESFRGFVEAKGFSAASGTHRFYLYRNTRIRFILNATRGLSNRNWAHCTVRA